MALFAGYDGAYGTHGDTTPNVAKGGKLEIRSTARTREGAVDAALWERHLKGEQPLGLFPIRRDNTCYWGAIDVDDYSLSNADVHKRIVREKLPLIPCRSKSGGTHIYLFLSSPVSAEDMIKHLRRLAGILGFSSSEIFPKQAQVLWDKGDFGSWINMPYLAGDKTDRYAVGKEGRGLTLRQFLDLAEAARVDPGDLDDLGSGPKKDPEFGDGPPCIVTLINKKFQRGEQNNGIMALAVFAKKKYPDQWQKKLQEWTGAHFDPAVPLNDQGLKDAISSNQKKSYNYRCNDQPLAGHCNAGLCRTRRYGVSGGNSSIPKLANLAVLDTDEPVWFLDVNSSRIQLKTDELLGYNGFMKKVMEVVKVVPPPIKLDTWVNILQGLLDTVVVIEAPAEVGIMGQFMEILETHLTDRQRAQTKEEILLGKAWLDEETDTIWFRLKDIQEACDRMRFKGLSRTQMTAKIRELGGGSDFFKLRGKGANCWYLPASLFSQQTEPHATPKLEEQVL